MMVFKMNGLSDKVNSFSLQQLFCTNTWTADWKINCSKKVIGKSDCNEGDILSVHLIRPR